MTKLSEEQKKLLFLELQEGVAIKSLMEKFKVTRPTITTIRNLYTLDPEEERTDQESVGESLEGESESGEVQSVAVTERSDGDAPLESGPVEPVTYQLDPTTYLPTYHAAPLSEAAPSPVRPSPEPHFTFAERPPPLPEQPAPPAEYNVTKDQLFQVDKIKAYVNAFPHKVGAICGETDDARERWLEGLRLLPVEKLREVLEGMKYKIQQGGLSDFAFTLVCTATFAIETGGPYVGLNLKGYSDSIRANAQAREAILEIMCEHMSDVVISPEKRLLLIMLTTMYNVHKLNETSAQEAMEKPAPPTEQFDDL